MILFHLASRSLRNRLLTTVLTIASIALSVALLVGIENVRVGMRESFSNTISRTDLIVGARGGTTQLLLYSVFGIGSPTQNVSWVKARDEVDRLEHSARMLPPEITAYGAMSVPGEPVWKPQ